MMSDSIVLSSIRDTVSVIETNQVVSFYTDMMDKQAAQFNILLVALGVVVAIVIGATWWWNYRASKAQITDEINIGLKKFQRVLNSHKASMPITVEKEVSKYVNNEIESVSQKMEKELKEFKDSITKENKTLNANLCRVFALHCSTSKYYLTSANWWFSAFEGYNETEDGEFQQISIDAFIDALKESAKSESITEEDNERIKDLLNRIETIPGVFTNQKKEAKKLLKQIQEKGHGG